MIKITDLSKIYKMGETRVKALDQVSLSIQKKEFVAIVGPSGSGKSTLMNILGCLDVATQGTYELEGRDISGCSDNQLADIRNKKIGFIFQGFNLLPKLNAMENVELPLTYLGVGARERRDRSAAALKSVGLGERIHHRPAELSGGQQQRVAIARALVTNPPIILADEPTGNLDSKSGAEVLEILKKLHQDGNTIILITHDLNIAQQAPRVVRIHDGRIAADGEVAAL